MTSETSVYDQLNGPGPDYDYWRALARRVAPRTLCDLGCGTGMLTVLLAADGYDVTGVDPDPEALAVARSRPGHDTVTWLEGYAADLAAGSADLLTMTGHVSQVFVTDDDWRQVLTESARILRPGGVLAFDMRNPAVRGWEAWNPTDSRRQVTTEDGPAEVWHEVTEVRGGVVRYDTITQPTGDGVREVETDALRFRDETELRATLDEAGFTTEDVHGDWDGSPVTPTSRELLVTARLRP